jgi:hypothetical protein
MGCASNPSGTGADDPASSPLPGNGDGQGGTRGGGIEDAKARLDAPFLDAGSAPLDASAPKDAGPSDGSSDAGPPLPPLYPLNVGRTWQYRYAIPGETCNFTRTVTGLTTYSGKPAASLSESWVCTLSNGGNSYSPVSYAYAVGDHVETPGYGGWVVILDTPVVAGHTWKGADGSTSTWKASGPVATPAGTFSDCWTVQRNVSAGLQNTTYCRGVGMVSDSYAGQSTTTLLSRSP